MSPWSDRTCFVFPNTLYVSAWSRGIQKEKKRHATIFLRSPTWLLKPSKYNSETKCNCFSSSRNLTVLAFVSHSDVGQECKSFSLFSWTLARNVVVVVVVVVVVPVPFFVFLVEVYSSPPSRRPCRCASVRNPPRPPWTRQNTEKCLGVG